MMPKRSASESNVQKALRLRQELETTTESAIKELLDRRKAIEEQLQTLGYAEGVSDPPDERRSTPRATRGKGKGRVCGNCGERGHNKRSCKK
jgi:hypothetical protein